MLTIADGPRSPLVVAYFLVIALAALRLSLPLMWMATLGSMAGYLFLLGYVDYYAAGTKAMSVLRAIISADRFGGLPWHWRA